MHVFYSEEKKGNILILEEGEVKHFRVRRIGKEEEFGVIYEERIYLCKVEKEEKSRIFCKIVGQLETKEPHKDITLYQCITVELKTMDTIVRQITELGVKRLVPIISERSFRKKDAIKRKFEKWKKIAVEAMKQAKRPIHLHVSEPMELEELEPIHEENIVLDNFYKGIKVKNVNLTAENFGVVVGPEGGFSEREGRILREKGFKSVILEPYTLKSETAAVSIVSILMNC
ncbi:MAG TPA: RsmE family RNA methyltransferase [Aquifex aeolicus]|nr:RsmE family RNA methyltransferase [Aquifex aeolicus]